MAKQLNPSWMSEMKSKIYQQGKVDEVLHYRPAVQWLMTYLAKLKIPFKVINLGVGVYKVTTDTTVCPKCGGSGRI